MSIEDVTNRSINELVNLSGRSAVVTGAAKGLGKASARRLAEAGASVLIGDIDAVGAKETAEEITAQFGVPAISIEMDVSDSEAIKRAVSLAVTEFGSIDIWVNNAGIPSHVPLLDLEESEWDRVMAVNLRGLFVGAREAARRMIEQGNGGVIINLASLAGYRGIAPGQAAYVTSKHGVRGATRQMAMELAPHGIRVLAIAPGFCVTESTAHLPDLDEEAIAQIGIPGIGGSPLGRVGVADDIARVVLFCASDMSLFMSGTTQLVDGALNA